ncbi:MULTISPECIES: hypothetical protein [unclassified Nocardioides]|uniref:hypothetical protein n=1 Tax=unclassified Nocardioides TaxID=2615069 RepID=UPI000702B4D9|nr:MULTISPECIES: hypothetical protein [unclassified Nocardioides]KRC48948.1 hypothetical protein ASE19_18770 [Nocardioides sp. Root79]KRC75349.1 hypothetical protein ASE20_20675 [Nocardioides sp. Root240]
MLTDDDLTRQLEAAFREASADLRYDRRVPTARRTPSTGWLAVPAVATVAALAVAGGADESPAPAPEAGHGPTATPGPRWTTDTVTVAGYTFTYRHAPGERLVDDLHADLSPARPPDDATAIAGAPAEVDAWVGTDPDSGQHALWVEAPTRNGGRLFALLSPSWTEDQLKDLFLNGEPRTVPATG